MHSISFNIAYDLLLQHETRVNLGGFERMEPEAERFGTSSRVYRRAVKELLDRGLVEKASVDLSSKILKLCVLLWPALNKRGVPRLFADW